MGEKENYASEFEVQNLLTSYKIDEQHGGEKEEKRKREMEGLFFILIFLR